MEQVFNDLAFPLWRFLAVFANPPRDLQSVYVVLVDNFFFVVVGRLLAQMVYAVIGRATEES